MHCSFCAIAAGTAPAVVVHEDDHVLGFMDALPMTPGHALLIPKRHARDLLELGAEDGGHLMRAASALGARMVAALGARGLNLLNNTGAAADQSQFHFHFHLIPRYGGDRLLHPYERSFGHWPEIRAIAERINAFRSGDAAPRDPTQRDPTHG